MLTLEQDPHIKSVWGINSGLGFQPPNDWSPGDFIIHFAGKNKQAREVLLRKYSVLAKREISPEHCESDAPLLLKLRDADVSMSPPATRRC